MKLSDLLDELFVLKKRTTGTDNAWNEDTPVWTANREFNGRIRFGLRESRDFKGNVTAASATIHCEVDVDIQSDDMVTYETRELEVLNIKKETGGLLQEILLR